MPKLFIFQKLDIENKIKFFKNTWIRDLATSHGILMADAKDPA